MKRVLHIFLFFTIGFISIGYADSPITSTDFYKAYTDVVMVQKATNSNGKLTVEFCEYLNNKNVSIDKRIALINALSWDIDGKNNYKIYFNYLNNNVKKIKTKNYLRKCSTEQLICLAYLKAMDDYFNVDEAYLIADAAIKKNKSSSFSIAIIYGLIKAQYLFNNNKDWEDVYKATDDVRKNRTLQQDMKPQAIKIIFDYMDLYK